jgi:hypothetical protein
MTTQQMDDVGVGRGGRMSRQRKRDAMLRLLRGEDLDMVSRSLGVTAATLSDWRDAFLGGGEASLATKPMDGEERLRMTRGSCGCPLLVAQVVAIPHRRWVISFRH